MNNSALVRHGANRLVGAAREVAYLKFGFQVTRPYAIRGSVNQRCNYKCQYCYCWQRTEYPEMTISQWQGALLSLKEFIGRFVIQFSGGEPFLKKGFCDLLNFCHANDIDWGVVTNGTLLTPAIVARIVDARPLNVDVSVDSTDPKTNDFVRGAKNSIAVIGAGIERLCEARRNAHADFLVRIKPTVTRQNFHELPKLVTWTKQRGADLVDFAPVRPEPFWQSDTFERLWINTEDIAALEAVVGTLVQMKNDGEPIETSVEKLRSFPDHFLKRDVSHGVSPCRVGLRDYHISATGDVEVCWLYPPIGNVTRQSAKEIWLGDRASKLRERTIACEKFKSVACANSCLAHRTLAQEARRALQAMSIG